MTNPSFREWADNFRRDKVKFWSMNQEDVFYHLMDEFDKRLEQLKHAEFATSNPHRIDAVWKYAVDEILGQLPEQEEKKDMSK